MWCGDGGDYILVGGEGGDGGGRVAECVVEVIAMMGD